MNRLFTAIAMATLCTIGAMAKDAKETVEYTVGMKCQKCADRITKELTYTKGVTDLKIDVKEKKVWVEYKPKNISADSIKGVIAKLGYEVGEK